MKIKDQTLSLLGNAPMRNKDVPTALRHAVEGLLFAVRTQRSIRIQSIIAALVLALGIAVGLNWLELAIIGLTIALVLFAELVNTITETVVDLITSDYHPLAKTAKDLAAGAVLLAAIGSIATGALILGPRLIEVVQRLGP